MSLFAPNAALDEVAQACADDRFVACAGIVAGLHFEDVVTELKALCDRFVAERRDLAPLKRVINRLCGGLFGRHDRAQRGDLLLRTFDFIKPRPFTDEELALLRKSSTFKGLIDFSVDREPPPAVELSLPEWDALKWIAEQGEVVFGNTWTQKRLAEKGLIEQWGHGKGPKFQWTHSRPSRSGIAALIRRHGSPKK